MYREARNRVHAVLEVAAEGDRASRLFDIFLMSLISLNILSVIIETEASIGKRWDSFLGVFELISVIIFSVEYVLRVWSCTSDQRYRRPIVGRLKFAVTPMAIVDLLAVLPFYIPMLITVDLRFLRALRLFRLFRIFKMGRYSESMKIIANVLHEKKSMLLVAVFVVVILLIIASSLLYFVENAEQPEVFSSIPAAMWWGVATLTTVGYGDVVPVTGWGKFLGSIIAMLGVGLFALPAGILASGFSEEMARRREGYYCPRCGEEIREE